MMTDTPVMNVEEARELLFAQVKRLPTEEVALLDAPKVDKRPDRYKQPVGPPLILRACV